MQLTLIVGDADFALDAAMASELACAIREALLDDAGLPIARDPSIGACLELANVLTEGGEGGSSVERIQLGALEAEGLCVHVLGEGLIEGNEQLAALHQALQRLRGRTV